MKIYDISLTVSPKLPVWPGDPQVEIRSVSKIEEGANCNVSHLSAGVHVGTHVDAPYHFVVDGVNLDKVPLEQFVGPVVVVEVPAVNLITAADIQAAELHLNANRVLFKTRNSDLWAAGETQFEENFVALSPDAAEFLVESGVILVGIDYLSIAPYKHPTATHQILLEAGVSILEGVDLSQISPGEYTLFCLPLKLDGADGAPARAILVELDSN